jgi:hypothetical protein
MGRRSAKQTRIDSMNQFQQRKYKKKNSPDSRRDSKGWQTYLLEKLQEKKTDERRP